MEQVRAEAKEPFATRLTARVAIFDLDRTLRPGSSAALLARLLVRRGALPRAALVRHTVSAARFARHGVSASELGSIAATGLRALAGLPHEPLTAIAGEAAGLVTESLYAGARWLVDMHLEAGDFCILLSASPQELVERVSADLDLHRAVGTRAAVQDGHLTGALEGPLCHGPGKLVRLRAEVGPVDLTKATAYGDSRGDIPLLAATGRPVAVHPDRGLRAHARAAGWPVLRFDR